LVERVPVTGAVIGELRAHSGTCGSIPRPYESSIVVAQCRRFR
jgi:hypothetical protein